MNLIVCGEHCRHQNEGYCTLNRISSLTADASAKCGYFEASGPPLPAAPSASADYAERSGN